VKKRRNGVGNLYLPLPQRYTLPEAWSGLDWADLIAAQGAFGTDFYDRSSRTIVGTMLWTEYRPVIKIGPKGALGSHEIRPIHSAPSLGQSIGTRGTDLPSYSSLPTNAAGPARSSGGGAGPGNRGPNSWI